MPRTVPLVVPLVAAVLVATGCTPGARSDGVLAGATIEVAGVWTGAEQATFRAVLDAFEERTGAQVHYTSGGDDLPALLNSRLAGGSPPDVALVSQPSVVAQLARRGALVELTGEAAVAVGGNFSPFWR